MRDFCRDIGTRAAGFSPKTFLRGRPKDIAILVAEAHRCICLVLTFLNMMNVVLAYTRRAVTPPARVAAELPES